MKVLVATHSYAGNGAAVMLLAVLEHWVKDLGWTVDVLLDLETKVPDELVHAGVNVFSTADPANYDFALVNTLVSAHFVEMLAPRIRTVLWVHEGETVLMNSPAPVEKWRHLFGLPWKTIFQTRWQSDAVFKTFLLKLSPNRVACVRNGMPSLPADIKPAAKPPGRKRIVFVGGVYGRKRPQDLVDAILLLDRQDVEGVFVGPVENIDTIGAERVARIRANPDKFRLAGQLDRAQGLSMVSSADVFCLPSGDESQPIAPLEAAALGIPCALSDLPPYADIWRHGINCLTQPPGDVRLLRWNLAALLDDAALRAGLVDGAHGLLERFSIAAFLQRFTAEMPTRVSAG